MSLFLGKRDRENQQVLIKHMLFSRKSTKWWKIFENGQRVWSSVGNKKKNYQCGLDDKEDESNGKVFESPGSERCPVILIEKYLSESWVQQFIPEATKPVQNRFNPARDTVWYFWTPLGHNTLKYVRFGTTRAGINPHLANHLIRDTTVTVLSVANIESRHVKAITGHQSESASRVTVTFEQFRTMWY